MVAVRSGLEAPFIKDGLGALRCALVVPPAESIEQNPPLYGEAGVIAERAASQFEILERTLSYFGVRVVSQSQPGDFMAASSVADLALVLQSGAVLGRPSALRRRGELPVVEKALQTLGIPVIGRIETPATLDCADVIVAGGIAYVGVTAGTNAIGRLALRDYLQSANLKTVEVRVDPTVRRLRNVMSVVAPDRAVVAASKLDTSALSGLHLIEVPPGEDYGADVLVLEPNHVLANLRFVPANTLMKRAKIRVEAIDLYEYAKIGLGPSSIVLPLARKG